MPSSPTTTITITDLVQGPIAPRVLNAAWPNVLHTRIADVIAKMGPPPWACQIIKDERNVVSLIANDPGSGNRPHWHADFDEWWIVLEGTLRWELTGGQMITATKDDIIWVPRGTVHHIENVGTGRSLRLAIAMPPAMHYYNDCEQCGYSDDGPRQWDATS
ncbi:MAG: cupin domain-containing protein [Chloroflexota bacterium]